MHHILMRSWPASLIVITLLACKLPSGESGGSDDRDDEREESDEPQRRKLDSPAPFVHQRPVEPQGVDACGFTGGLGMACLDALLKEPNAAARRFMRRLSDAHAHLDGPEVRRGESGPAHAELTLYCKTSGPCGGTNAEGAELDDGYACLTAAEAHRDEPAKMKAYHARACRCSHERAQIPVMGGTLACDGANQPVERGGNLTSTEAANADACGRCDPESGPAACRAEIERLRPSDPQLADYIQRRHVPHCQSK